MAPPRLRATWESRHPSRSAWAGCPSRAPSRCHPRRRRSRATRAPRGAKSGRSVSRRRPWAPLARLRCCDPSPSGSAGAGPALRNSCATRTARARGARRRPGLPAGCRHRAGSAAPGRGASLARPGNPAIRDGAGPGDPPPATTALARTPAPATRTRSSAALRRVAAAGDSGGVGDGERDAARVGRCPGWDDRRSRRGQGRGSTRDPRRVSIRRLVYQRPRATRNKRFHSDTLFCPENREI